MPPFGACPSGRRLERLHLLAGLRIPRCPTGGVGGSGRQREVWSCLNGDQDVRLIWKIPRLITLMPLKHLFYIKNSRLHANEAITLACY